jgi:hypothetical protein
VLSLREVSSPVEDGLYDLDLTRVAGGEFRRSADGWHAIVPLGGATHRIWLATIPASGSRLAVELCLDANFDVRLQAARRLWQATEGRRPGNPPLVLPNQRRQRLTLTIRALDAWLQGNSYREIAVGLFGKERISDRSWKAHDLRSRIIRLVEGGRTLMRGGYRALLRPQSRNKR